MISIYTPRSKNGQAGEVISIYTPKKSGQVIKIPIPGVLAPFVGLIFIAIVIAIFTFFAGFITIAFLVLGTGALVSWAFTSLRDKFWPRRKLQ